METVTGPLPFSAEALADALSHPGINHPSDISEKKHFKYLLKYLGSKGLNAKTIVVEDNYVSKDFLEDYAAYYAFSFNRYDKFCKRIHLFKSKFDAARFKSVILKDKEHNTKFWDNYLGFIVVKPIATTVIGYTLLKALPDRITQANRKFLRKYPVHLFGSKIEIESLVFQEQDGVLAACATTAIWSMLSKASASDHAILKSPVQITKDAGVVRGTFRLFPNDGLTLEQIFHAVSTSGLELLNFSSVEREREWLPLQKVKAIVYAYSTLGIPIILIAKVPYEKDADEEPSLHAFTVCGYDFASEKKAIKSDIPEKAKERSIDINDYGQPDIQLRSDAIDKLYAHDDQVGPFCVMKMTGEINVDTEWKTQDEKHTQIINVLVPVYPKIRITYKNITVITNDFNELLINFLINKKLTYDELVWDINLMYSEDFKADIRKTTALTEDDRISLLMDSLPKYLWVATCWTNDVKIFTCTFDATDVSHAMIAKDVFCFLGDRFRSDFKQFLADNKGEFLIKNGKSTFKRYYDYLLNTL